MKATICALAFGVILLAAGASGLRGGEKNVQQYLREPMQSFDFEFGRKVGLRTPPYWKKVGGRGLPAYTEGRYDSQVRHGGQTSFSFQMKGGDCLYEYYPKRIPVDTAYDYCLEGWIRTEGLKQSRAYLGIWFNDQQGRRIPGTKVLTSPLSGQNDWTRLVSTPV